MDLLVSYNWGQFSPARHEILRILKQFGDAMPWVDVVGRETGITLLRPQDIFSIRTP